MNTVSIDISAPPDRVWDIMFDVENWSAWTPSIRSIRRLDSGPLTVGSRVVIRQPKFPPARWKITEMDAGHSFTWESWAPGMLVTATHSIMATSTGCTLTLSLEYRGPVGWVFERLVRKTIRQYLDFEAAGLKRASELPA